MPVPLLLLACAGDPTTTSDDSGTPWDPELVVAAHPTMEVGLAASWSSGSLQVSAEGATHLLEGLDEGGRRQAVLLAPARSTLGLQVVDGDRWSAEEEHVLPDAPTDLATVAVRASDPSAQLAEGALLYSGHDGSGGAVLLADRDGGPLWYARLDDLDGDHGGVPVELARDGEGVLTMRQLMVRAATTSVDDLADNELRRIGWDGEILEVWPAAYGHHLFDQPEAGTLIWIRAAAREVDDHDDPHIFEEVVELDLDNGEQRVIFDSEVLGFTDPSCGESSYYAGACDPFHANAIDCHADSGRCALSLKNLSTVVLFSRETGEVLRDLSELSVTRLQGSTEELFAGTHDVRWRDADTLQIFHTGLDHAWAALLQVDLDAGTLTEVWTHGADDCVRAAAQGGLHALGDGHELLNYGVPGGLLREVDAAGEVVWEGIVGQATDADPCEDLPFGTVLGQAGLVDPDQLPDHVLVVP